MSTIALESAFSQGRQELGDNRHSLGSNAMHVLVCLRDWIRPERRNQEMEAEPNDRKEKMKVIAAYLLAVLGGNTNPTDKDLKKILASVGAEGEDDRIQLLLSEVKGKDITELIAAGREKLASVPSGGGAVAVAASAGGGAAAPAAEEKKEEKKAEEKEESDDDMGFSLFD
ncbi:60S acidic ribosomal protein P2B [Capsicum baccatum]|uniref:60S acidic ribosomal protein P2B n=2 Tax=Capsicum TaxID=4071 RepID=A0A2G2VAU2_CAPBA|nr:60S acidic ribosomal protein P2B [Capsicum baccatum]